MRLCEHQSAERVGTLDTQFRSEFAGSVLARAVQLSKKCVALQQCAHTLQSAARLLQKQNIAINIAELIDRIMHWELGQWAALGNIFS